MKKTLLVTMSALLSLNVIAQKVTPAPETGVYNSLISVSSPVGAKTTAVIHDSLVMTNVTTADTNTLYYISHTGTFTDSGYLGGTNGFGYSGFAERYDFNSTDSTVSVIGVVSLFGGKVNPATAKTVTFKAWSPASASVVRPTLSYSGFPGSAIDSIVGVSIKNLGIGATADTFKSHYFPAPTAYRSTSFFVGYMINYNFNALGGDTIGLQTTRLGERTSAEYTVTGGDTVINDQNAIYDTSFWLDVEANLGFKLDFYIFPIVDVKWSTVGVAIARNDLTFFGNYPNPAVNNTNVRYSLNKSADVTIVITDMNGRTINTISQNNLSAGEHATTIETANLPAGNYLCILRTSQGDGIASKMTVIK